MSSSFYDGMQHILQKPSSSLSQDIALVKEIFKANAASDMVSTMETFLQSFLAHDSSKTKTKRQAVVILCALGIVLNDKATKNATLPTIENILAGCMKWAGPALSNKDVLVIIKVIDNLIKKRVIPLEMYSQLANPFIELSLLEEDPNEEAPAAATLPDNKKHAKWVHPSILAALRKMDPSTSSSSSPDSFDKEYTTYLVCKVLDLLCDSLVPPKEVVLTAFEICHKTVREMAVEREHVSMFGSACLFVAYKAWESQHPAADCELILQTYSKTVATSPLMKLDVGSATGSHLLESLRKEMQQFIDVINRIMGDKMGFNPPLKKEDSEFELCCKSLSVSPEEAKGAIKIIMNRAYKYSPLCITHEATLVSLGALVISKGMTKAEVESLALSFGVDFAMVLSGVCSLGKYKTETLKPFKLKYETDASAAAAAAAAAEATAVAATEPAIFPENAAPVAPFNPFLGSIDNNIDTNENDDGLRQRGRDDGERGKNKMNSQDAFATRMRSRSGSNGDDRGRRRHSGDYGGGTRRETCFNSRGGDGREDGGRDREKDRERDRERGREREKGGDGRERDREKREKQDRKERRRSTRSRSRSRERGTGAVRDRSRDIEGIRERGEREPHADRHREREKERGSSGGKGGHRNSDSRERQRGSRGRGAVECDEGRGDRKDKGERDGAVRERDREDDYDRNSSRREDDRSRERRRSVSRDREREGRKSSGGDGHRSKKRRRRSDSRDRGDRR